MAGRQSAAAQEERVSFVDLAGDGLWPVWVAKRNLTDGGAMRQAMTVLEGEAGHI